MPRGKVLCLGVSHAQLPTTAQTVGEISQELSYEKSHVADVIECVQSGQLTQMDGRDLIRCIATELHSNVDVYTVSQEQGANSNTFGYRSTRHLDANFNRTRTFLKLLKNKFVANGKGTEGSFDQIVLDYYWIPSGWADYHWSRSFFQKTLPGFVKQGILYRESPQGEPMTSKGTHRQTGRVYLPFCLHCFREVLACRHQLLEYYNISFLQKKDLQEVSFWAGTQTIDKGIMQTVFGKHLQQEETYCTFGAQDIAQAYDADPRSLPKQEILEFAHRIDYFHDIRFIMLEALSIPDGTNGRKPLGQIFGLKDPALVQYGITWQRPTPTPISVQTPPRTPKASKKRTPMSVPRAPNKYRLRSRTKAGNTVSPSTSNRTSPVTVVGVEAVSDIPNQIRRALFKEDS